MFGGASAGHDSLAEWRDSAKLKCTSMNVCELSEIYATSRADWMAFIRSCP